MVIYSDESDYETSWRHVDLICDSAIPGTTTTMLLCDNSSLKYYATYPRTFQRRYRNFEDVGTKTPLDQFDSEGTDNEKELSLKKSSSWIGEEEHDVKQFFDTMSIVSKASAFVAYDTEDETPFAPECTYSPRNEEARHLTRADSFYEGASRPVVPFQYPDSSQSYTELVACIVAQVHEDEEIEQLEFDTRSRSAQAFLAAKPDVIPEHTYENENVLSASAIPVIHDDNISFKYCKVVIIVL